MATSEEILKKVNIVDVIGDSVALEKRGKNHLGLCPFHDEKTPSFSVSEEKQLYHCFGCKASGNAITFLKETRGLSGNEALKELAERAGLDYSVKARPNQRLYDALDAAKNVYHVLLTNSKKGEKALDYLTQRHIDDALIKRFELGVALPGSGGIYQALSGQSFLASELLDAGLLTQPSPPKDFFKDRLMIPIKDAAGQVTGFSGRILADGEPKYLNSADNVVFKKHDLLFGLYEAKKAIKEKNRVLITEGFFDVFRAHQAGFGETIGLMGTSLSASHIQSLARLTQSFYLVLDGDAAGQKATEDILPALTGLDVKVVTLPEDADLDTYLRERGAGGLSLLLEQALDPTAFTYQALQSTYDLTRIGEFERFKKVFYPRLKKESLTSQSYYLSQLAELTGIQEAVLRQDFLGSSVQKPPKIAPTWEMLDRYKKAEIQMLHYFLHQEFYTRWFRREFKDVMYIDPRVRDIQFEIFEHYDLHPVSCLVYPLFKASLTPSQQRFLDAHVTLEKYPFNAEEFEDLISVLKQYQIKEKVTRLKADLMVADSHDEKVRIKERIDALKKELTHGIR